jgi:serine/threonine protein kinase
MPSAVALKMTVGAGTPMYRSYEKAHGLPYDSGDDMWAVGCIFLELSLAKPLTSLVGLPLCDDDTRCGSIVDQARRCSWTMGTLLAKLLVKDCSLRSKATEFAIRLELPCVADLIT